MKGHSIQHEIRQQGPAKPVTVKAEFPEQKKWKTIVAILALIGAAFLIFKLQKSDPVAVNAVPVNKIAQTAQKSIAVPGKKPAANPTRYLTVKNNWHKNLVGEIVLEGVIQNTARLDRFRDPVLLVTWFSKTNTPIGTYRVPLYEDLGPGQSLPYKTKVKALSKIGSIKVTLESAMLVQ